MTVTSVGRCEFCILVFGLKGVTDVKILQQDLMIILYVSFGYVATRALPSNYCLFNYEKAKHGVK